MVDRQNRVGYKGTGFTTQSDQQMDRRERLRRIAMETIDLTKDPYYFVNHVGTIECRLCLTVHTNEVPDFFFDKHFDKQSSMNLIPTVIYFSSFLQSVINNMKRILNYSSLSSGGISGAHAG